MNGDHHHARPAFPPGTAEERQEATPDRDSGHTAAVTGLVGLTIMAALPTVVAAVGARPSLSVVLAFVMLARSVLAVLAAGFVLGLIVRVLTRKAERPRSSSRWPYVLTWMGLPVSALGFAPGRIVVDDVVASWAAVAAGFIVLAWLIVSVWDRETARPVKVEAACMAAFLTASTITVSAFNNETLTWLAPSSPSGCRLLAAEQSFALAGGGTILAAPALSPLAFPKGTYSADDGAHPIADSRYTLQWREAHTAELTFTGDDVLDTGVLTITC